MSQPSTKGCSNLARHIENMKKFGVPVVVAINHFITDTEAEIEAIKKVAAEHGAEAILCTHWADGSAGPRSWRAKSSSCARSGKADFKPLYPDEMPLWDKVRTIATSLYGAGRSTADKTVRQRFKDLQSRGLRQVPGLHGQDAVLVLDRPEPQGRADGPFGDGARGAAVGRRRVHRGRSPAIS